MDKQTGVMRQNCCFRPVDFAAVQALAKDAGLSFSGGLRMIIREWATLKQLQVIGQAYAAGLITGAEAVERLAVLTAREV